MQFHLNIAEFGGDKHGTHVPGSHSPGAKRDLRRTKGMRGLLAREDNFHRFNIALSDADLLVRLRILNGFSPAEAHVTNATYFIENDKSPMRNRDRQEGNRIYVRSMYIILTALRVRSRIAEKMDEEVTKGGEKRSGY